MPLPNLHILHPREDRLPGVTVWMAEVEQIVRADPQWDNCVIRTAPYDHQASFDVPTQVDHVRRAIGPVILVQNVQARVRERFERMIPRGARLYCLPVTCSEDLWQALETARQEYDDGEPRIPLRELIAYLIVRKLERQDKWGGTSLNKAFLWSENLPKGGFPKDLVDKRAVFDVARELERFSVLATKVSNGQKKYALGAKPLVQPILDSRSFANVPGARAFFEREPTRVTIRLLEYNDEPVTREDQPSTSSVTGEHP